MTSYPKPVSTRSGCKVAWYTYDNRGDAETAAVAARERAVRLADAGYDFGYCSPGEITERADGSFVVTVP